MLQLASCSKVQAVYSFSKFTLQNSLFEKKLPPPLKTYLIKNYPLSEKFSAAKAAQEAQMSVRSSVRPFVRPSVRSFVRIL